jgi:hypothetical protein
MDVRPQGYRPRIVDEQIERYLRIFGAVEVQGTKWCGKTWTSRAHAQSLIYVDRDENLALAQDAPEAVLAGANPRVIDEWQRVPKLWDYVRHAVDEADGKRGLWILTGSSTPAKNSVSHSGAGRVGRVRMSPMTLFESGASSGAVSLAGLFEGSFEPAARPTSADELLEAACRGGWPEVLDLPLEDAQIVAAEYLSATLEQSIPRLGKDPDVARRLVASLARNLGQAATCKTLQTDMYGSEDDADALVSERSVANYLQALESLYLVEPLKGWVPPRRSPKRVRTGARHYFADPSIAAAVLGMNPASLLRDWQTFGLLFENLCLRDLAVYVRALPGAARGSLYYYRDDTGLEADAVIELADGRWAAVEVKTSQARVPQAVENLVRLRNKLVGDGGAGRVQEPAFLMVLTGVSEVAYRTSEGVYVVPITLLGP